jgi:uncharacterized repeat protein (TIGR01451 family)
MPTLFTTSIYKVLKGLLCLALGTLFYAGLIMPAQATTFTETVPNGNGPIPNTYPPVGGTMFVLIGANGNIYYQFVNPSTQFRGFAGTGTPTAFQGIPTFQLGPTQALNCGIVSCSDYFGGSIVEGYARLTVRDADACPGNFDHQDVSFEVNGITVASLSDLAAGSVERTNFAGTSTIGTEDCFRNQGSTETSTSWFDLSTPLLSNILSTGGTTPFITDTDTGSNTTRGDNFWFFTDGNDATGTPEVAPGITIEKTADRTSYVAVGDIINYEFLVTNIGSVQLNDIVVDDTFITGAVTCPLTSLSTGQNMTCTGQHVVTQANIDDDDIFVNTASVTANPTEGQLGNVSGTLTIPGPAADPSMTISKTASATTNAQVGDVITYTYVVENTGNVTIDNVTVADSHAGSGTLSAITPASVTLAPTDGPQTFTATYEITQADFDAGVPVTNTATANGTPRRGTLTPPTDDAQVAMAVPMPEATFAKLASPDADANAGDTITYTYTVANTGDVTLTASVSDVHSGTGTLSAITPATADIAPGANQVFTATYVVTQEDFDDGTPITNTATADLTPARGTIADPTADESVTLAAAAPARTFTKTANFTSNLVLDDTVTYTYTVANTGNTTLTNLSVSDVHSGSNSLSTITPATVATLAPGDSVDFTATYIISQQDMDAAVPITNVATLSDTTERGTLPPLTANESVTTQDPLPSMSLTKTADTTTDAAVDDVITYTYVIQNTGDVTLTNVSVSDAHNGTGTLSAIAPATVATLAVGDSATFTATYTITQADIDAGVPVTNTATANATPASGSLSPTTATESVAVESPAPEMTLAKTASDTTDVSVGDVITYSYLVTNTGNVGVDGVSVSDVHSGTGTLSAITPVSVDLAPGEDQTFTATYTVTQSDIDAGTAITNTATANGSPAGGALTPPTDTETVSVEAADPEISLTKAADVTTDLSVGQVVTYTYTAVNTGNVSFSNLSMSDAHSGTGTLSAIMPANVATLAVGDTATFTATYTVTQADIDSGAAITNTATANATPASGTYTPATADESVQPETAAPEITFAKAASKTSDLMVGETITYTYTAENTGNVSITGVSVSDAHSGSGTLSAITPATTDLVVGQTATFTASYIVTQADIDAGVPITNTATVTGTPAIGTLPATTADASVTPTGPAPSMSVDKRALDTDFTAVGDVLDYEYELVNTGNVSLSGISVSDDKIASVSCPVTTLAPGARTVCTASYSVTQADLDAGSVTNIATGNATPAGGTFTPSTDSVTVDGTQTPSLSIDKAAQDTTFAAVGDVLDYSYTVTNTGNVEISGIAVSDDKIASVSCPVTTLAPGANTVCTASYSVTQADIDAGAVTNIATTSGTPAGGTLPPATDSETVDATQTPSLGLVKSSTDTTFAAVGDTLDYSYVVTNTGNVTVTDPVTINDDKATGPISCPALPAGGLAPAASLTCSFSYSVTQADLDAGSVTNVATATDGTLTSPSDTVTIDATQTPQLSMTKVANETTFAAVGDVLTYDYTVANTGNVGISSIAVTDDKIASVSCNVAGQGNGDAVLDPAEIVVCTASYSVTQADLDAGAVTNVADVTGTPSGGTLLPTTATETVDATQSPELTIVKAAGETSFDTVGDVLTYTYTVTNSGNVGVTALAIADDKIASVTCPVTTLAPTASTICTASYTVTQADIDAGDVTNIATANATPAGGTLTPPTDTVTVTADQTPGMGVVKTATTVNFELPGDITTYEYVVTNTGNTTLTDPITVTDNLITTVTCPALPAGGLAPAATLTCTADYVVTQADLDAGSVTNLASASSGALTSPQTSETIPADQNPALSIVKRALSSEFTTAGEVITYEFDVTNDGNLTLTGGVDVIDDKIGTISCVTGNLVPGATQTCSADYTVTQADVDAGSVMNQAYADNDGLVSAPVDVTVDADRMPSLSFVKTADQADFTNAGETLTYTFNLDNTGNVTLTNVAVSDDLIASVSCPATTLAPGATMVCTASYVTTQADADAGFVTNNATGSATPPPGLPPVSEPSSATVTGDGVPSLSFAKRGLTADFDMAGDVLSYEFDVANTGATTLTNVSVTDSLIASVSCPLTTLAPGASMVCSAQYTVTQADVDAGSVTNNASAGADGPDGTPLAPQTDSVTTDGQVAPAFTLVKASTATAFDTVGTVLDYTYTVTNTGNVTITGIALTDDLIPSLSCPATTLAPSASLVCTGSYTVTQADIDAGAITNNAEATGTPAGGTLPPATDAVTIDADVTRAMEVVKTASVTDFDSVGDVINYTYVVTNTGNTTLIDAVTVSDDRIASVSCPALPSGGLAPAATLTCSATFIVTQADIDAGAVTNIASATSGAVTSPDVSVTVDADVSPSLAMTKIADPQTYAAVGESVRYDYVITNTGNVTVTDPLRVDDDQVFVTCPALPAGGLAPGATLTCTATDTITQADLDAGTLNNVATATDGTTSSPNVSETVTADAMPSLSMVKTALDTSYAAVGDLLDYEYVVTNTGNITLTDPVTISDDRIANVSCPALPAGVFAPGATMTCSATYTVTQADIDAGDVINVASASSGGTTSPTDSATATADQVPALSITKSALQTSFAAPGDVLDYTYAVRNTGNVTLIGAITVSDDRIASVTCPALPMSGLAPQAEVICTASYVVTQADVDAGDVTNIASATDGTTTSPTDSATVNADQTPSLNLIKSALQNTYTAPGQVIDYSFEVVNDGNITVTDPITISDSRIASVSCPTLPAGGLLPGASLTCTATDTVTQADIDAGVIENIATASAGGLSSDPETKRVFATRNASLEIEKTATNINFTLPGDITTYEYVVTNAGNTTITDPITVTDDRITPVTCPALPAGGLAPGATLTCSADYVVTQDNLDIGSVTNIATATDGTTTSAPTSETIPANANPAIEIRKSAQATDYSFAGEVLTYDFEIQNTGNITLTGSTSVVDNKIGTVVCFTGNLVPGATQTCSADYTVTQEDIDSGSLTNDAYATHPRTSSPPVYVTLPAVQMPELGLVKTAQDTSYAAVGDVLSYTYTVSNTGNVTIVLPISVTDDRIRDVMCAAMPVGGLRPGQDLLCTGTDTVTQADLDAGSVTNTATATDGTTTSLSDTVAVDADQQPSLAMVKTAQSSDFAAVGDVLDYAYTVRNTGNITLTDAITISDDRIASVTCPALPAGGLVPGASLTCTASDTITQADLDAGIVTNIASATSGAIVSPTDTATITGTQTPAMSIAKTARQSSFAAVGDIVSYDYAVTNIGNVTLTSAITVADDKIASVTCPALPVGGLAPQAVLTCSADYAVTQADIDAGSVTNVASATDGTTTSPDVSETVSAAQAPSLGLVKRALTTDFNAPGDTLDFEYVVTNTGNLTLTSAISVSDDRITVVTCPALPAGGLVPGASVTCTGTDTLDQADIDAGFVTNTATATDGTTTSDPQSVTVSGTQTSAFTVDKIAQSNDFTALGDVLSYDYIVRNTGNVSMTQPVSIQDDKIGTIACPALPAGGLVPGATLTCSADYTVVQADLDAGEVTNIASALSGGETSAPDTVTITGTREPALGLVKATDATSFTAVGETIDYTYVATNTGNVTLLDAITVSDDRIADVTCPALPAGGLAPGASLTCTATDTVTQADLNAGGITNVATATSGDITSDPQTVTVAADQAPALTLVKTAVTENFNMVGDLVAYDYTVTNTGNVNLIGALSITDDKIATSDITCPTVADTGLVPGASLTCRGEYAVTQADLDAGEVTNLATATLGTTTSAEVSETLDATRAPALALTKSTTSTVQQFGPIHEVTYDFTVENTGNVTLDALQITDDLTAAFAPATLFGTPTLDSQNLALNANYDGATDTNLLAGSDSLAVGETRALTLTALLDITNGGPAQGNTAFGSSPQLNAPVRSDDNTQTPDNPGDTNSAPLSIIDTDGDGSPDNFESGTADRDGDGVPDAQDYDPTGYFYCEENGAILAGGSISVSGPLGTQTGVGSSNDIVIVQDGSDGYFQFYVTAPGQYQLTPTYPTTGVPSTIRRVNADPLDVTSVSGNPAILGSSEVGDTGRLADFSAETNSPYYFEFDIEAGDPHVLLNNIPLKNCGVPSISVAKSVTSAPSATEDGRQAVTYQFVLTNTGETNISDVALDDDLGAVFGDEQVTVSAPRITDAPAGFDGTSPAFTGTSAEPTMVEAATLAPGESVTLELDATIAPLASGEYVNTVTASATAPLDGAPLRATASAGIELEALADPAFLRVTKTASPRTVQIGDPVLYTIAVTNESPSTISGVDIVDLLPEGFAYVPGSATVSDATQTLAVEPTVRARGQLSWAVRPGDAAPLDTVRAGETISVQMRLLAGPNVDFGSHENRAYAENVLTGVRSQTASAIVDYIPEPSFDCTPVIGRVYDDVNHNGYPDDGEPGLPAVRLVTVNGDIVTTDMFGRYHIPCAIIADAERGSNFLLKMDTRSVPLGYRPTTENPRVVRATRGKFVKMNFGAGFRTKLRLDFTVADFNFAGDGITPEAMTRVSAMLDQADTAERAILVYNADEGTGVDAAQARLQTALVAVMSRKSDRLNDIALEAVWQSDEDLEELSETSVVGQIFGLTVDGEDLGNKARYHTADRARFVSENGTLREMRRDEIADRDEDTVWSSDGGLRGDRVGRGYDTLASDTRRRSDFGRSDSATLDVHSDSPRPGRLQRWVGWGNTSSSYSDGMEIETTVSALDPIKRLNGQANVVNVDGARVLMAEGYTNYDAFIERLELRVFDAKDSARGEPIAVLPISNAQGSLPVAADWPEDVSYVLRAYDSDGVFDETARKRLRLPSLDNAMTVDAWNDEALTAYGQSTLQSSNIRVRGGTVRVYGRNVPGASVTVLGQNVSIDESGRFVVEQLLPTGDQAVTITAAGETRMRSVTVPSRDTFAVGQIEATVGDRLDTGVEAEGRVAFYVRSRLNDRWTITATADTGEAEISDLISGLDDKNLDQLLRRLDPDRYYPTYGDDSTIEQDAPTSGRIYARVERDDDYALWGNYRTDFDDTEFARVRRTLYGAKFNWDENAFTKYGDERTEVTAYLAEGGTRQGRDELRGTGGSVYYLRRGDISIGSELVRIETRDEISGLVLESRRLQYGTDYDMDFIQGRLILNQPLRSTGADRTLFRDGSLSGNRQVLVVDYEFSPIFGADTDSSVYGIRGSRWFGDVVKFGATYGHDDAGGAESDIYEADLTLQFGAGTYLKGEIARSEGAGVAAFESVDGGFTYNPVDRGGLADGDTAMAYAVEGALDFAELDLDLDGRAYAYWRKREAGFAGYAEATTTAVEQFGAGVQAEITDGVSLDVRADVTDTLTRGSQSFAEGRVDVELDEAITLSAGLSYNDDGRGNDGTSLGLRGGYKFSDDTNIYVFGQAGVQGDNTRTTDRIGAGAEVRVSSKLLAGGEISTGEDGLGARATVRRTNDDGDEMYLGYDLPLQSRLGNDLGTFNVGARERFSDSLSVYGEERLQFAEQGLNGVTHAYGVDFTPGNWNFGLSAEVGKVDDLDREAFSASAGFRDDRMRAGVSAEWREDENVLTGDQRRTWLLRFVSQYQASDELTLQGKLNLAHSDQSSEDAFGIDQSFNNAEFTEASISAAFRPIWDDRFNMLGKVVWLEDLSPTSQRFNGVTLDYRQRSRVVSVDTAYDVSEKWTLGGKYAHRSGSVTSSRDALDFTKSSADLGVIRLDYHLTHQWDASVEGRWLDIGDGVITRTGGLAGIYRHMNDNAKLGVGVTWGGIDEQYLSATEQDEDELGWFINMVGKF